MSTGCEFYTDALVELARGDLEAERVQRVEVHLSECRDCRETLAAIRLVQAAPAPMPGGLEERIQAAIRGQVEAPGESAALEAVDEVGGRAPGQGAPSIRRVPRRSWSGWRAWALPLAAAAVLVIWFGGRDLLAPGDVGSEAPAVEAQVAEYDPYGAWPASDGVVAGDLMLSELSVDELEALLEEMR